MILITFQSAIGKHIPVMAIVAVHEVRHRLISPLNLDLDEACLLAVAFLTPEHSFVIVSLLLDQLDVPVSSTVPHSSLLSLVSLLLHFFRGELSHVTDHEILWSDLPFEELEQGLNVFLITQIENDGS